MNNRPISEQFEIEATAWVDADAAASLLEDCKSAIVAQWITELGDIPHNRAEAQVKASPRYVDYVHKTVAARKQANLHRVRMEALKMRYGEHQSEEANERTKARL